jgi:hypothetical protein
MYGYQPMAAYPYIPYCHPMTIRYVEQPWPYHPMYRYHEAAKPLGNQCAATKKQGDWRWCNKCQALCYSALGTGVCPVGGAHDFGGSGKYYLNLEATTDCSSQAQWRWCNKCQSVAFAGAGAPSACAAGGAHAHDEKGGEYFLCLGAKHGQHDWTWCCKCSVLFYSPFREFSKCPATGSQHDSTGSGSYQVYHDPVPDDPSTVVEQQQVQDPAAAQAAAEAAPPPAPQSDCCCVIL